MRILVLLLLALTAYGAVQTIIQTQQVIGDIEDWVLLRTALWGIIVPLSYHSIISIIREKQRYRIIILSYFYFAGLILIILSLSGYTIFKEHYYLMWGWGSVINPRNWFFWAFLSYLVSGVLAFILFLIVIKNQTENYRKKKLANAILVNFLWGSIFTVIPYVILSWFKVPTEILLAYAGNVAQFLIIFAIQKYHPDKFSPKSLLSSIYSLVPDNSLLLTPDKKLICPGNIKMFSYGFSCEDFDGQSYTKLFMDTENIDREMNKIKTIKNYSTTIETELNTDISNLSKQSISITGLRDELNDIIAFLLVFNGSKDNTNQFQFLQDSYDLSKREREVAILLLEEYSNNQICDILFISPNTVKTHTRNIYRKTNTANRAEFKDLCGCS